MGRDVWRKTRLDVCHRRQTGDRQSFNGIDRSGAIKVAIPPLFISLMIKKGYGLALMDFTTWKGLVSSFRVLPESRAARR